MIASICARPPPFAGRAESPVPSRRTPPADAGRSQRAHQLGSAAYPQSARRHPAEIVTELGETLRQTPLGVALTGDLTTYRGPARSIGYRWLTDPSTRQLYALEEQPFLGRMFASGLREVVALRGPGSRAAQLVDLLQARSEEVRTIWDAHEIGLRPRDVKHYNHPTLGRLELTCQSLPDPDQSHRLLVYTAIPGSESHEKLQLLSVIGSQAFG